MESMEESAVSIIGRAVKCDNDGRYQSALVYYQEGIQLFLDVIKMTSDKKKQEYLRQKASEYMTRAEKIKALLQKQKDSGVYHEQIQILNNGVGFSYKSLFGKYLDTCVKKVEIEDPYIRTTHQICNFLCFCEMLLSICTQLNHILLITGANEKDFINQNTNLNSIKSSLLEYNVELTFEFSPTLHDREIRIDNGWVIKIGRGLDYFKPIKKFSIGFCDQNLRRCNETTVDIYFKNK